MPAKKKFKFEWKAAFLNGKRARAYADKLKKQGKRVRVRTYYSGGRDNHPVEWMVDIWSSHPFSGRNFHLDENMRD